MLICLLISALCSSSENAFFSIKEHELEELRSEDSTSGNIILKLLAHPKKLLATILILNNLVNVAFVIVSSLLAENFLHLGNNPLLKFLFEAVSVTLIILLFGEVLPKVYATQNYFKVARLVAYPMNFASTLLSPFSMLLVKTSSVIDKRITRKGHTLSIDELNYAIEITSDEETAQEEKSILKGIVNFGNITVRQIMRPRVDVMAADDETPFTELVKKIKEWRYSRVPVYHKSFDDVKGILYSKDLIPHLEKDDSFRWTRLLRQPFFVPENKKINDLLEEFQDRRIHMAIVVDEFGGTNGVVTMEDILEEIFGEIQDEFDEESAGYSQLDSNTWIFEGRTLLNDFCRVTGLEPEMFDEVKGENETLAGLVVEMHEGVPAKGEKLSFANIEFTIEAAEPRVVNRIKVYIP